MDLEILVRLMQMQVIGNSRAGGMRDAGVSGQNFALILAALMDGPKNGTAGLPSRVSSPKEARAGGQVREKRGRDKNGVSGSGLESMVDRLSAKYGLNPALLKAVVKVESDFNPLALSNAGAMGLMQLMPDTASSLGVKNPYDPLENLEGGARYLKSLMERFKGDLNLALAAYNAGPGAVERYGGVPPYRETARALSAYFNEYRKYLK